jgi:hypothetical protein
MKRLIVAISLVLMATWALARDPDCSGVGRWPTSMAFGDLKNAGITTNDRVDFGKTKTVRLVSERMAKDLYRQVHLVTFTEKSGRTIEVITVSDASSSECSMGDVEVFVIARHLGAER